MDDCRWVILFSILLYPMMTDLLYMEIPIRGIGGCIILICGVNLMCGWGIAAIFVSCFPAVIFAIYVRITKQAGEGDVWIVLFLGLVCGWSVCMEIIFWGTASFAVYAIIAGKRQECAFMPWIVFGSYTEWLFTRL